MKRTFALTLLVFSAFFFVPTAKAEVAAPPTDDCYIQNFLSDITVKTDSSADINEDLTVDCAHLFGKHGIFRILPYQLLNRPTTEDPTIPIELHSITDEQGASYKYQTLFDSANHTLTWKIGDPDTLITGIHHYLIKYSVKNVIQHPEGTDLFAWNLNGNFWELVTQSFTAQVHFPTAITPDNTQVRLFSGEFGGTDNGLASYQWIPDPHSATSKILEVKSSGQLGTDQGITAYVGLPQHIFAAYAPSWLERFGGWLWLLLIPVIGFFFWVYWQRYGQDKKFGAQVVFYDAPGDMRPMELGFLDTYGGMRPPFITATIIDLAVRGYLTIMEIPKEGIFGKADWELTRTPKDGKDLKAFEDIVLGGMSLEQPGEVIRISALKNSFYTQVPVITQFVKKDLDDQGLFDLSAGKRQALLLLINAILLGAGIYASVLVYQAGPFAYAGYRGFPVALIACAVMGVVFMTLMSKRTDKGAELEYQLKGFKQYMKTAEQYRAQFYEKENMFEKILPYAILFGLTDKWIKATRSLATEKMSGYVPIWYMGTGGMPAFDSFDSFSSQMNSISQQMSAAMAPPASSGSGGFGGGGFSGGGGGGGGGGSW